MAARAMRKGADWTAERAIVLQVLDEGCRERWSRTALARAVCDVDARTLEDALGRLLETRVLCADGPDVGPSPALRRLDELELLAV